MNNKKDIEEDMLIAEDLITHFKQTDNEEEYETAEAIENILADREKYKRLAEQNLKDSEEFKNNMCEHRCVKNTKIIELRAKANKYDSLIKEIGDKINNEELPLVIVGGRRNCKTLNYGIKLGRRQVLQELLYIKKEKV